MPNQSHQEGANRERTESTSSTASGVSGVSCGGSGYGSGCGSDTGASTNTQNSRKDSNLRKSPHKTNGGRNKQQHPQHQQHSKQNPQNANRHCAGGGHHHHPHCPEMTLLCHRVDLFDDFVASAGKGAELGCLGGGSGLVPIRCLGVERGCACRTPCSFCHLLVEDYDDEPDGNAELPKLLQSGGGGDKPPGIHEGFAFLFAGQSNNSSPMKNTAPTGVSTDNSSKMTKNTPSKKAHSDGADNISRTMVLDPIFAQNHGMIKEHHAGDEGTLIALKKFHHPPIGRFRYRPPELELPEFFGKMTMNGEAEHVGNTKSNNCENEHRDSKEEKNNNAGLDSFFDNFATTPETSNPNQNQAQKKKEKNKSNDKKVLVFRTPLKTVVKRIIKAKDSGPSEKCYCQVRYELLKEGSTQPNPHDPSVVHDKYWAQRRRLFKKFDEGIQLDAEGWYSVTPEVVADHVASRFADAKMQLTRCLPPQSRDVNHPNQNRGHHPKRKQPPKGMVILDAFCGCGGNAIAFAKLPSSVISHVVCIDVDRSKLRKAAHNASIYSIPPNRIIFIEANSVAVMERCYRDGTLVMDPPPRTAEALSKYPPREIYDDFTIGGVDLLSEYAQHIDAIFMDPPWGGVDYGAMGKDGYDLARDMKIRGCEKGCVGFPPTPEVDGVRLLKIAASATSTRFVAYDLPRNTNKRSLAEAALEAGYEGNSKLEEHYLNNRLKTVTAYFGQDFRQLLDLKRQLDL